MRDIKLITFDLDDTFWDIGPPIIKAEKETRHWLDERVPGINWGDFNDFIDLRNQLVRQNSSLEWDISELRKEFYKHKLKEVLDNSAKVNNLVKQAYKIFIQKRHDLKLYDGLVDCIKSLSNKFMLGILTNGNADINNFSIGENFSFSVSSLDVKSNKPDIGHFNRALELSGFSASESLHIGDHQINDMLGAHDAGFSYIWFNSNNAVWNQKINKPKEFSDWNLFEELITK